MSKFFQLFIIMFFTVTHAQTSQIPDTLFISSPNVIFFHPSQNEIDSLYENQGEDQGFTEVISDYFYHANGFATYLKENDIPYEFSSSIIFILNVEGINVQIFDRKKVPELFGYIFIDSTGHYQVENGVDTDAGLIQYIENFLQTEKK